MNKDIDVFLDCFVLIEHRTWLGVRIFYLRANENAYKAKNICFVVHKRYAEVDNHTPK